MIAVPSAATPLTLVGLSTVAVSLRSLQLVQSLRTLSTSLLAAAASRLVSAIWLRPKMPGTSCSR